MGLWFTDRTMQMMSIDTYDKKIKPFVSNSSGKQNYYLQTPSTNINAATTLQWN